MYQHILLAVALQRWDTPSPHALATRDAAVALAKGAGARLSVLSVYEYEDLDVPDLAPTELGRYREAQMQRIDGPNSILSKVVTTTFTLIAVEIMLPAWVYVVLIGTASNAYTFARLYKTASSRAALAR